MIDCQFGSQCSLFRMWGPCKNFGKVTQERLGQRTCICTLPEAGCIVDGSLSQGLSAISTPLPLDHFSRGRTKRKSWTSPPFSWKMSCFPSFVRSVSMRLPYAQDPIRSADKACTYVYVAIVPFLCDRLRWIYPLNGTGLIYKCGF